MKKKFYALLSLGVLLMFMFSVVPAYAAENNNNVGFILTESDAKKIENYSRTADISATKKSQQIISEGYYSYTLKSPDVVTSAKNSTEIKSLVSDDYCIVVPTEKGYIKYLKDTNGDITYVGDVVFNESLKNSNIVNISVVKNILSATKYADATDVIVLDVPMYHTSFVYFLANNVEYLIPFGSRPDLTGLENEKVYKANDCLAKLSATWGSADVDGNGLSNGNGGHGGHVDSSSEPQNTIRNSIILCLAIASFAFVGVIAMYSIRKVKRMR